MGDLTDRMALILAELGTRYPARIVSRSLKDFADQKEADLLAGIYTLISLGEGGYANYNGREAEDGKQRMKLVGQILLSEDADSSAIEDAEFAMVEEIKVFVRDLPAALCTLVMKGYSQSGQLEAPYGWISIDLEYLT